MLVKAMARARKHVGNKKKTKSRASRRTKARFAGRATPHIVDRDVAAGVAPLFRDLESHPNPQKRGQEFERLIQRLFRLSGYDAERNPAIARPRQTDLLARYGDDLFLLEAKWENDPSNISVIDGLHSRLIRAPRGTIGCCFSMTSFTRTAIERAKQLRGAEHGHELLLFDQVEVAALMNGWLSLHEAVRTKRRALREAGEVRFLRDNPGVPALKPLDIPFPQPSARRPNDLDAGVPGRVYNFAFGELPSSFEVYSQATHGFQIYGSPMVDTVDDLSALLQLFHSHLRLFGDGGYTIAELRNERTWFGTSADRFIQSLAVMGQRHALAGLKETHHSEEFTYYDVTRLGGLVVYGRQNISTQRLYSVSFELRLPGIPLDYEPLRSVANALGLGNEQLTPIERDWIKHIEIPRTGEEFLVEPVEYLRDGNDPQYVSAAVVRNPFFSPSDTAASRLGEPLRSMSVLVGRVGDYLAEDERVHRFHLRSVQVAEFRMGHVADVFLGHDEKQRYRVEADPDRTKPIFASNERADAAS
jgi:hypothetical protein